MKGKKYLKAAGGIILVLVLLLFLSAVLGNNSNEPEKLNDTPESSEKIDNMTEILLDAGLTKSESKEVKKVLNECGVDDLKEVERVVDGDNGMKIVVTKYNKVFGFNIGLEDGKVFYVDATGVKENDPQMYMSLFGKLKIKNKEKVSSVTMYEDGTYYLKFDKEEFEFKKYSEE